jgi:hypothetical protein
MKRKFSPAQMNYMKAKAYHETIKDIEAKVKTKVLAEQVYMSEDVIVDGELLEKSHRITRPTADFMMSETDFTEYCKLCFEKYKKAGLDVPDYNTTPDYKSFQALKEAEKALIEWGYSVIQKLPQYKNNEKDLAMLKERSSWDLKVRDKLIELTMMCAA